MIVRHAHVIQATSLDSEIIGETSLTQELASGSAHRVPPPLVLHTLIYTWHAR